MNFALSEDQLALQANVRGFLESNGYARLGRRYMDGDDQVLSQVWDGLADLGYLGLIIPEEYNGTGLDLVSATAVMEEIGRAVVPGPVVETGVFAAALISRHGTAEQKQAWLPSIAGGEWRCGLCLYEGHEAWATVFPEDIQTTVRANGGSMVLSGTKTGVWHGVEANQLLVMARSGQGNSGADLFMVQVDASAQGVEIIPRGSLDQTRSLADISFNSVPVEPGAIVGGGPLPRAALEELLDAAVVALSGMMVGGMDRVVEMSVEYANTRHQFGQPIGRFQAIKHRIVDMKVDLETGRSLTYYAAWALDTGEVDGGVAASSAKAFCSEAFVRVASHNIQNHGGMGFTWDHDAHLYLKRAKAWQNYLGSPIEHRERVAERLGW